MGNILVFFPGNGAIKRAIKEFWSTNIQSSELNHQRCVRQTCRPHSYFRNPIKVRIRVEGAKKVEDVLLYSVLGRLSRSVLTDISNRKKTERLVFFSTSVAETGVTLPDVRYVVDTGLQRSTTWDPETCVTQMVHSNW